MKTNAKSGAALIMLIGSLVLVYISLVWPFREESRLFAIAAAVIAALAVWMLVSVRREWFSFMIGKKFLITTGSIMLILLLGIASITVKNVKIAGVANDFGRKYGVTDFRSRSAVIFGGADGIELFSKDFERLTDKSKFDLMVSIGASAEMKRHLADWLVQYTNPLMYLRFEISTKSDTYKIYTGDTSDTIGIEGRNWSYSEKGIEEHGYVRKDSSGSGSKGSSSSGKSFTNKYGTSTTKCAHSGCSKYIASSGDTNCCTTHSNRCGNCNCYIDEDAVFCMTCLTNALK